MRLRTPLIRASSTTVPSVSSIVAEVPASVTRSERRLANESVSVVRIVHARPAPVTAR
jgi:hypothetical protein